MARKATEKNASKPRSKTPSAMKRLLALCAMIVIALAAAVPVWLRIGADTTDPTQLVDSGAASDFNLLLVTLDTVRSDHLGCYGYSKGRTPAIDSLAQHGVLFEHAVTPMPLTLPSHTTMLTGLYPPRHGVRGNGNFRLSTEFKTFTETLKERGYETAAFIGCFVLDARFGLDQGFDVYDFEASPDGCDTNDLDFNQRSANAVSASAINWLKDRGSRESEKPFFMWVHYFDAHRPYNSPYVKLPQFSGRPYDAEIAYVDVQFKRLLDELDRRGLRERTLIVVVSDHGEGLDEHGETTHGMQLYDSTLRVAFIVSNPALFAEPVRVADRIASLTDLAPTLADLLGFGSVTTDGVSLFRAKNDPDRAVYIETQVPFHAARCSPLYGLRRLGDKYIRAPEAEYYEVSGDPRELANLYAQRSTVVGALETRLSSMMDGWVKAGLPDGRRVVDPEEQERLSALGYVQMEADEIPEGLPDPKTMLQANRQIGKALQMFKADRFEEALRYSQEAVRVCPAFPDGSEVLASVCDKLGRQQFAIEPLRRCLKLNPKCRTAIQLARMFMGLKRYDEMEDALKIAEGLDSGDGMVWVLRGDLAVLRGRFEDALARYEKAVRIDEHRVGQLVHPQIEKLKKKLRRTP